MTAPGRTLVGMARGGAEGSTGAFVVSPDEATPAEVESPATTLERLRIGDAIFVRRDSPLEQDVSWD